MTTRRAYISSIIVGASTVWSGCLESDKQNSGDSRETTNQTKNNLYSNKKEGGSEADEPDKTRSLHFAGHNEDGPDHINFEYSLSDGETGSLLTLEYMIAPEDLGILKIDEYYTIHKMNTESNVQEEFVRLYGDGSIGLGMYEGSELFSRTDSGIIHESETHRISVQTGETEHRVFVDGDLVSTTEKREPTFVEPNRVTHYIGTDSNLEKAYKGGIDDIRIWTGSEYLSEEFISEYAFEDLRTPRYREIEAIQSDNMDLDVYFRFNNDNNNSSKAIGDGVANATANIIGADYQDGLF